MSGRHSPAVRVANERRSTCETADSRSPVPRASPEDGRLLASVELSGHWTDLPAGQSSAGSSVEGRTHQAAAARPLAHDAGAYYDGRLQYFLHSCPEHGGSLFAPDFTLFEA